MLAGIYKKLRIIYCQRESSPRLLHDHGVMSRWDKSCFLQKEIDWAGFKLTENGIRQGKKAEPDVVG